MLAVKARQIQQTWYFRVKLHYIETDATCTTRQIKQCQFRLDESFQFVDISLGKTVKQLWSWLAEFLTQGQMPGTETSR